MVSNNTQIPVFVDFLQLSVVQEESLGEWLFVSSASHFYNFPFEPIPFSVLHFSTFSRSCRSNLRSSSGSRILELLQSSAYNAMVLPGSATLGRSLMNIMKNRGTTRNPEESQCKLPTKMKNNRELTLFAFDLLENSHTIGEKIQKPQTQGYITLLTRLSETLYQKP